jgi:hypothetical protein
MIAVNELISSFALLRCCYEKSFTKEGKWEKKEVGGRNKGKRRKEI